MTTGREAMTPGDQQGHAPGTGGTAGLVNAQSHAGTEGDADHLCHPCQTPIPEPPGDECAVPGCTRPPRRACWTCPDHMDQETRFGSAT